MKKNKMMRVASALLVAVLMTTSVISGTFAKYVTTDSAKDSARVAKWGVTVLASGTLFGENYFSNSAQDNGDEISADAQQSVDTTSGDIVAPGTKNTTGMILSITGTPEVATKVTVSSTDPDGDATNSFSDIYLANGTYAVLVKAKGVNADNYAAYYVGTTENNATTYAVATSYDPNKTYYELHDEVNVSDEKYYPVVLTLTKTGEQTGAPYSTVEAMFNAIKEKFETSTNINEAIDKEYTVTWEWAFEDANIDYKNGADTILGNLMVGPANDNYIVVKESATAGTYDVIKVIDGLAKVGETTVACLNVAFDIKITVEQVD